MPFFINRIKFLTFFKLLFLNILKLSMMIIFFLYHWVKDQYILILFKNKINRQKKVPKKKYILQWQAWNSRDLNHLQVR